MKIWEILKNFWELTGEVDVDPKEEINVIENATTLSSEDKEALLKVLSDVNKQEAKQEEVMKAHYTSHFGQRLHSSVEENKHVEPEVSNQQAEKQEDLEL